MAIPTTGRPAFTFVEVGQAVKALETIAGALQTLAQGHTVGGKPAGDGPSAAA